MGAFSHILTFMAFVFGFSVGQLLLRLGALVAQREQVRFSGLGALAVMSALLLVLTDWLSLYDFHDVARWTLPTILPVFLLSLSVCFICMISAPLPQFGAAIDLEAFYWHQRKAFFWTWAACEALAILCNALFAAGHEKLLEENAANIAALAATMLPLAVPKRWAQWTGLWLLTALTLYALVAFEGDLG